MSEALTRLEPREIEQLTSDELVRLLHRLLHCEARKLGLLKTGILVPAQINVPDGGQDGRWNADIEPHEFIPRSFTLYQCKAEHITAAKCRNEVTTKRKVTKRYGKGKASELVVKERVREVLSAGGCYAFFCSKQEIERSKTTSLDAIARDQLEKAGFIPHKEACIEFFGCNRIADWANKFPAAVRYVKQVTRNLGGVHFYTVEGWSRLASVSGTFFENEALSRKIASIQDAFSDGTTRIIRLNGLSGVGKSRLVYEALRLRPEEDIKRRSISESSIYLSYADMPKDLVAFVSHLADNDYSGIIVIDDCPPEIHDRIVNITHNSSLSIISIYHQPEPSRSDSLALSLDPDEMEDVVERLLREDNQLAGRGDEAIKAVASFAKGFPQFAKLITEFHRAPTLQELRDRGPLFQRLLSRGEIPDSATLSTMQALAMFNMIGGSTSKLQADLSTIRTLFCPTLDELDFRGLIEEQKSRKVLQQIADTLMLVLRPLAVALAADFIQHFPLERWRETVERLSKAGLLSAFARRLEELEFSDKGEEIGKLILENGLPFEDAEYLLAGTTGSQMFRALSVLNPSAATRLARRSLETCSLDRLRAAKEPRRDLVRALEFLTWEPQTFPDAATLLLRLAAAENETWANNATGSFKQLFNLYLSGTKVPAFERLAVIRNALQSSEPAVRSVAIHGLGAGLNFVHFMRMMDGSFRAKRKQDEDWRPANRRQELDYWKECYKMLRGLIAGGDPNGGEAKEILGRNLGAILQTPLLLELDSDFKNLSEGMGRLWPEAKDQIRAVLEYHEDLSPDHRAVLERWVEYLTPPPEALEDRIKDIVSTPGWHHRKGPNGTYVDLSCQEAERLASGVAQADTDLVPYLRQLMVGEQQQGFTFGANLGKCHSRRNEIVDAALDLWPRLDPRIRNASFLRGLMFSIETGSELRAGLLDRICASEKLVDLLVPLTASVTNMEVPDLIRIRRAFGEGRLEVNMLKHLIVGQPLGGLPDDVVTTQLTAILEAKHEAAPVILEIIGMHCSREPERRIKYEELFKEILLLSEVPILGVHSSWEWQEAAKSIIATTQDKRWLRELTEHICATLVENETWVGADSMSAVVSELFERIPGEAWQVFGSALKEGTRIQKFVLTEFLGRSGTSFEDRPSPIWRLPEAVFRGWIRENREQVPLILEKISLYTVQKTAERGERFEWHPFSLLLLEEGCDEKVLARSLISNLLSFGSTGSRVPYLERRLALVKDLAGCGRTRFTHIARAVENLIEDEIERTRRDELNERVLFQ